MRDPFCMLTAFFCDLHDVFEHVLGHVLLMCGDTRLPFLFLVSC